MFYAVDFDSLTVESKSKEGEDIAGYIVDNNLSLAVSLVSCEDDLSLNFTLAEMQGLHNNIEAMDDFFEGKHPEFSSEEQAAKATFAMLVEFADDFPTFTAALGKKLVKNGSSDAKAGKQSKASAKTKTSTPRTRITLNRDDTLSVVDSKCKQGSILHTIVTAIDDEMCGTVGEVLDYIVANHTIPKTGELADMKFAEHNVKYFLKQGKISNEEEL